MEGRAPQPDAPLASGTRFGTYRIERLIGSGGMGSVYEALHVGLKKRVAIKILHSAFAANDEVVARFLREGEATSRIGHPNVVDVTDLGVKDGIPYLVMELLVGESLSAMLAREKILSPERAVDVLLPMISAVGMAHDEGVVHRDLKPDNIFLAKNRLGAVEPKLLDFGISKMVTRSELTTAASVLGTPHYLSPEQAQALRDIDGRADQYSLSVILYRAVTGALPIGGGDVVLDVLIAVAQGRIRPPRVVRPELPEALERVIMRGLATLAKDRYPHTHLMGHELLPFASDEGRAMWRGYFNMRVAELGGDVKTQVLQAITTPAPSGAPSPSMPVPPPSYAPPPASMPFAGPPPFTAPPSSGARPVGSAAISGSRPGAGAPGPIPSPPLGVPVVHPGQQRPMASPSVTFATPGGGPIPVASPSKKNAATVPIAASAPRPRNLSDPEITDHSAAGLGDEEKQLYGTRASAGVLAGALLLAAGVIGGALWWSSAKDAPVAIPVTSERPVATYRIHVAAEPATAAMKLDGEARGTAPLSVELPADGRAHELEVSAPGYETEKVTFREGSVPPDVVRLRKTP